MRLALLILLMMSPVAAQAAAVAAAVTVFAAWIGTTAATVYLVAATVALTVGTSLYGTAQARKAAQRARDQARAGLEDRTITRIATESPHRYIYGRAKVGADIVAIFTSGPNDVFKHLVCVHAAHQCDAIEEMYIQGEALGPLDSGGNVTTGKYFIPGPQQDVQEIHTGPTFTLSRVPFGAITVISGSGRNWSTPIPYTIDGSVVTIGTGQQVSVMYVSLGAGQAKVNVQKHLGGPDVADFILRRDVPDLWPETAVLSGLCYTVVTIVLEVAEFQSGIPTVQALIRGRRLFDPRDSTIMWSANPALVIRDYLESELCGVNGNDIPTAQVITAANVCDEAQSFGARYTVNGTVTSDQSQASTLDAMAQSMAGGIVATTWEMYAGKFIAPVAALTQSDIVGSLSITPGASDSAIFNGVKGRFISPENDYVATDYAPYQNAVYLANDGRDLYTNIDFQFSESLQRAHNLARIFTEDQRNGFTIKAEFSLKAWPLKVGQRIAFTSEFIGQADKIYRITDKSFSLNSAVELTLKEDAASIWDFADEPLIDATPNTNLPDPWAIADLGAISCASGDATLLLQGDGTIVPRILVTWAAATTQAVIESGNIEIEHRELESETWIKSGASGDAVSAFITPANEGIWYFVRARAVNPYLNTRSAWQYAAHQALGKAERPPVVIGFSMRVIADGTRQFSFNTADQPVDVRVGGGYIIRYRPFESTVAWADMTPLHAGIITSSPYETRNPRDGIWDFAIESIDSSGNESSTAALFDNVIIGAVDYIDARALTLAANDVMVQTIAALNAEIAANKAESAQGAADAANLALLNIASDSILSPSEKPTVVQNYAVITAEQAGIRAQADRLGVSRSAYDAAINALAGYLAGLSGWNSVPGGDVTIDGPTFRARFASVYTTKQALLNAIADKAAAVATWDGIVGQNGTINTGNVGIIFSDKTVGTSQIADFAATDILSTQAVNFAVTFGSTNAPEQQMTSLTYTATTNGPVLVSLAGSMTASDGGTPGGAIFYLLGSNIFLRQSITNAASPAFPFDPNRGSSNSVSAISCEFVFDVVAGNTYTFSSGIYSRTNASKTTVDIAVFRIEAIKK